MRETRGKIDRLKMVIRKEVITKSRVQNLGERTWEKKKKSFFSLYSGFRQNVWFYILEFPWLFPWKTYKLIAKAHTIKIIAFIKIMEQTAGWW